MEMTLAGIQSIKIYLEVVSGDSSEQRVASLGQILSRLENPHLRLKKENCQFAVREAHFHGQRIDAAAGTEDKVQAILNAP